MGGDSARDETITLLVTSKSVSAEARRKLGPFVTRDEVARAIERELRRTSRFPNDRHEGTRIVVSSTGAKLVARRRNGPTTESFPSLRQAVQRYIEVEIGPSCGGLPIR